MSGPRGFQERFRRTPRGQEAPSCVQEAFGDRFSPLRGPRDLKNIIFVALNLYDFKEPPRGFKSRPSDITHTSKPRFPWSSSGEAFNDSCWTSPNPYRIPHRIFTASLQRSSLTLQKYRCFTESSRWNACTILTHRYRCPHRKLTGTPHDPPRIITF